MRCLVITLIIQYILYTVDRDDLPHTESLNIIYNVVYKLIMLYTNI
jgi:hypothetical protein